MTPCEEKGYKVGDRFKVMIGSSFDAVSIIELYEDDKTDNPLFKLIEGHTGYNCADGELGAYISLDYIEPINEAQNMTIKAGHKVKFADCAKHLKSYDEDAVGVVERNTIYGGREDKNNVKVKFTYPDGRELVMPSVNKSNLIRYRGSEYEAVKAKEIADKDGWIKWEGGECPVARGTLVDVKYRELTECCGVSALTDFDDIDHISGAASHGQDTDMAQDWHHGAIPVRTSSPTAYIHRP